MAVTTAKIRAREKATGKKAFTAIDNSGNLHYAFDKATLGSIITKANNAFSEMQSAKAYKQALAASTYNNTFNAGQVQKQMDFQELMSNTSHQREVKDLLDAGLNPILSANGGAITPAGSSASADTSVTTLKAQMAMQQMQIGAQMKMQEQNIESAQKIAKWNNDLNRELSYAQLRNNEAIANINAGASMYNAELSSSASKYAVDNPNTFQGQLIKIINGTSTSSKQVRKLFDKVLSFLNGDKPKSSSW